MILRQHAPCRRHHAIADNNVLAGAVCEPPYDVMNDVRNGQFGSSPPALTLRRLTGAWPAIVLTTDKHSTQIDWACVSIICWRCRCLHIVTAPCRFGPYAFYGALYLFRNLQMPSAKSAQLAHAQSDRRCHASFFTSKCVPEGWLLTRAARTCCGSHLMPWSHQAHPLES
jgi:hypothetical protein